MAYLVDATNSETESATFNTGAIHIVPNEENQLSWNGSFWKILAN
jgi:hypothetical protein